MSKADVIAAAKAKAVAAPTQGVGPEWPRWEECSLEDALTALEVQMWDGGLKFSVGLNSDGQGMWGRASAPKWSTRVPLQGQSAITFSNGLEHLLRKMAQLAEYPDSGAWKPDPYAK